jgi:hypothetical protein
MLVYALSGFRVWGSGGDECSSILRASGASLGLRVDVLTQPPAVWFPKGSSCVSVFTPKTKCYGKQKFIQVRMIWGLGSGV